VSAVNTSHPVLNALATTLQTHSILQYLLSIIDAHEKALTEQSAKDELYIDAISYPVADACAFIAGEGAECARHYAVALAAVEAANLPAIDSEHSKLFCELAEIRLKQAGNVSGSFTVFAFITQFYLNRLKHHKRVTTVDMAFWLPFYLWRRLA
jgi:hypothetical protein